MLIARQLTRALDYFSSFGLIHRDFRTTNLLVAGRGKNCRVQVIDLGHTIAAEPEQRKNRSAVVRCSWTETKVKQFDWAPMEVKDKKNPLNFTFPAHAFDVYSLAILFLQLETNSLRDARAAAIRLINGDSEDTFLGVSNRFLQTMLGVAEKRPCPCDVIRLLDPPHAPPPLLKKPPVSRQLCEQQKLSDRRIQRRSRSRSRHLSISSSVSRGSRKNDRHIQMSDRILPSPTRIACRSRSREHSNRSRSRSSKSSRSSNDRRTRPGVSPDSDDGYSIESELDRIINDGYHVWSPDAVAYGSFSGSSGDYD